MSNLPPEPDSVNPSPEEDVEAHLRPGDGRGGDKLTEPEGGDDFVRY